MKTTPSSSSDSSDSSPSDPGGLHSERARALVLGGGGSAGNAWLIGVLAGLFEAGLDVTDAEMIIGTSAGATAAAQITGAGLPELLADILSAVPPQRTGAPAPGTAPSVGAAPGRASTPAGSVSDHLERFQRIIADAEDAADMRRTMGAMALEADAASDGSGQERWRSIVASRLPGRHWPPRDVRLTAVDAQTGEPVVFDRHSGVDLIDAVAASTSGGGSAYGIGGRGYIDGGYRRSSENADLAAGCGRVLVLSPLSGRSLYPPEWGMQLSVQVDELRAGGSRVETVLPDADSLAAFGGNMMDPSTRMPAARAGREQGRALAERLTGFWRG